MTLPEALAERKARNGKPISKKDLIGCGKAERVWMEAEVLFWEKVDSMTE